MLDIRTYFDKSLELEQGDKMLIPCSNLRQQNSIRTQLNRMRKEYAHKMDYKIMETLGISSQELEGKLYIVIEMRKPIDEAVIIKANGSIKEIKVS